MDAIQQDTKKVSLRDVIVNLVEINAPIKSVDLVVKVMGVVGPSQLNYKEYERTIETLISIKEIVELEYISPKTNYKITSLYFSKGTEF